MPVKPRRRDADDGEFHAADADALVDDRRVGRKLLRPLVVVEHDDGVAARRRRSSSRRKARPSAGRTSMRVEEIAAHGHPDFPLRRLVARLAKLVMTMV